MDVVLLAVAVAAVILAVALDVRDDVLMSRERKRARH